MSMEDRGGKPVSLRPKKRNKKIDRICFFLQILLFKFLLLMRHLSSKRMLSEKTQQMSIDCCFPGPFTRHLHPKSPWPLSLTVSMAGGCSSVA